MAFCCVKTFRVPMWGPYMWYQKEKQRPVLDVGGNTGVNRSALSPGLRPEASM